MTARHNSDARERDGMHARQEMIATLAIELVAGINEDIDQPTKVSSVLAWIIELLADETYALVSAIHTEKRG